MSGEAPKKSRLRRRPTTEEDPAPRFAPKEPEIKPATNGDDGTTHDRTEPTVSPEEEVPKRETPRAISTHATPRVDEAIPKRETPRAASNRNTPRLDGSSAQAENQGQAVSPPPNLDAEPEVPTELDNLVPSTEPPAEQSTEAQPRGFHFRRGRKAPTEEPAPANGEEPPGTNNLITAEGNRGIRPMPRYAQYSMFDFLLQSNLQCGMGYNVNKFHRHGRFEDANPGLRLEADADGLGVGVTVLKVNSYGEQMIGIVKPLVKIHAVSIDTGYYIKSRNFPAVAPITTHPCALIDATSNPSWNEELILNAYFSDVVSDDTLLLFEILDDKPSLRTNYSPTTGTSAPIAKRVAWGYLLPIGMSGEMNVGFGEDWKYSSRRAVDRKLRKTARKQTSQSDLYGDDEASRPDGLVASKPVSRVTSSDNVAGEGADNSVAGRAKEEDEESDGEDASGSHKARRYPWDKPSVDKFLRIQLHSYRQYDGMFGMIQRKIKGWPTLASYTDNGESSYPNGVPEVYVQWRLQRRYRIEGAYLSIKLGPRPAETMPILLNSVGADNLSSPLRDGSHDNSPRGNHPHQSYSGPYVGRRGKLWAGIHGAPKQTQELARLRSALLKRNRGTREPCVIPDKLLYRVDVGNDGALAVSFSHSGHVLAIAAKTPGAAIAVDTDGVLYSIIIYDTDLKEEVWVEDAAHHGPIYDLKWSRDDRCLLSCSGDGTCKIWDMTSVSFRASNLMGFGALNNANNANNGGSGGTSGRVNASMDGSIAPSGTSGQGAASQPPTLLHTLVTSPPVYTYCGVFQDQPRASLASAHSQSESLDLLRQSTASAHHRAEHYDFKDKPLVVPRVITGSADGKLRVWDGSEMVGYVVVTNKDKDADKESVDYSPHDGQINSIVIDERSRYMITGDSFGDIFAWRCDTNGWYQLLRKFKRDSTATPTSAPNAPEQNTGGGILSLTMHPDKHKGQMLALTRQPAQLKIINMSTYKTQCACAGFAGYSTASNNAAGGIFARANYSADGRYAIAGSNVKAEDGLYRVQVWDTNTGHAVRTPLSDMMFPYPVRAISWHPTQHLLAVAMVGLGAAVVLYAGDRESAEKTIERLNNDSEVDARKATLLETIEEGAVTSTEPSRMRSSLDHKPMAGPFGSGRVQFSTVAASVSGREALRKSGDTGAQVNNSAGAGSGAGSKSYSRGLIPLTSPQKTEEPSKLLQSERAREMLERIRAAKAAKLNATT